MMNKTSCQSILENLKAIDSGIFLNTEELKQGKALKVLTPK